MSKESTFGVDCPGCGNKITFVDYHKCPELAAALAALQAKSKKKPDEQPKRKRRRRKGKDTESEA